MANEVCRGVAEGEAGPLVLQRQRRRATPRQASREFMPFTYVYILQSEVDPERFYVGITNDLRDRLRRHNSGGIRHTSKWKPWKVKTYIAMADRTRAAGFERYLKSHSGRHS